MIGDIESKERILALVQQNLLSSLWCLQRKILSVQNYNFVYCFRR